jgi:hypothetical protein
MKLKTWLHISALNCHYQPKCDTVNILYTFLIYGFLQCNFTYFCRNTQVPHLPACLSEYDVQARNFQAGLAKCLAGVCAASYYHRVNLLLISALRLTVTECYVVYVYLCVLGGLISCSLVKWQALRNRICIRFCFIPEKIAS